MRRRARRHADRPRQPRLATIRPARSGRRAAGGIPNAWVPVCGFGTISTEVARRLSSHVSVDLCIDPEKLDDTLMMITR